MKKIQFMRLLEVMFLVFLVSLTACSSGGGSGSDDDTDTTNIVVSGTLILPDTSPVDVQEVDIEVFDDTADCSSDGSFTVGVPEDDMADATVMLPQREGDSMPTVYLFTTLLPGETDIELSKEETAIGLLMNSISHDYLTRAGTPAAVKQVIWQNGQAFIQKFVQMIEQDPYVLRVENLDNVYDQTYVNAALACKAALQDMMPAETGVVFGQPGGVISSGSRGFRSLSKTGPPQGSHSIMGVSDALIVKPEPVIEDFAIHADTGNLDNVNIGGKMTGSIQIENDSMLFAHFKVTDMISGKVLQDLPEGFLNIAFNSNLLGPQGGWSSGYWASTGLYKAEFQSVIVEIYTAGLMDSTWSEFVDGPSLALSCRTMYSNVFIPVIGLIMPASEARAKAVFDFMADYGLFEIPLDKWAAGDWGGGAWDFVKKLTEKKLLIDIVKEYLKGIVTDHEIIIKHASKLIVKISAGTKTFELVGTGVDLGKLAVDVSNTHSRIEFHVIFPVSISKLTPTTFTKVADEDDNPFFKLEGIGFDSFEFGGNEYKPGIYLETEDLEGDDIRHTIDSNDLKVNSDGTEIEFQLPYQWAEVGSVVSAPIYVNLIHHFVDYSGINEVVRVELPEKAAEENFKIDLVADLAITRLSTDKVSENDELYLYGKGFAGFYMDNRVFFTDRGGFTIQAEVDTGGEDFLKVIVPEGLETGPLKVYVELKDKSKSNEKSLAMRPSMVVADPVDDTHFEDTITVWLFQDQGYEIYYAIDDGSVQKYTDPITLNKTANIYPFARATIGGVDYDSVTGGFFYYKCATDEELIDGECAGGNDDDDQDASWSNWPNPQWCQVVPGQWEIDTNNNPDDYTYVSCTYFNVDTGWVQVEEPIKDGLWDGFRKVYYENGQLKRETYYTAGEKNGRDKEYNADGRLAFETVYKNGVENGIRKEYWETGQQYSEIPYTNGMKNGVEKRWHENGQLAAQGGWVNDVAEGRHVSYYDNGQMQEEKDEFINGKLNGYWKYWLEDGYLFRCEIYRNGEYVESCKN